MIVCNKSTQQEEEQGWEQRQIVRLNSRGGCLWEAAAAAVLLLCDRAHYFSTFIPRIHDHHDHHHHHDASTCIIHCWYSYKDSVGMTIESSLVCCTGPPAPVPRYIIRINMRVQHTHYITSSMSWYVVGQSGHRERQIGVFCAEQCTKGTTTTEKERWYSSRRVGEILLYIWWNTWVNKDRTARQKRPPALTPWHN